MELFIDPLKVGIICFTSPQIICTLDVFIHNQYPHLDTFDANSNSKLFCKHDACAIQISL